ncbi:MAG: hypothetical protein WKG32_23350 [Gemmatimonadaceae bacterium]
MSADRHAERGAERGAESHGRREMLRHTLATLAYRGAKAVDDAPDSFGGFSAGGSTRTPVEILAHVGDLLDWAFWLAKGEHLWRDSAPLPWNFEVARFFAALRRLDGYLASDATLGWTPERLFQGPVADALTHVGQLTMLRRLNGSPVRGENYARAEISAGRVGPEQAAPRTEFE